MHRDEVKRNSNSPNTSLLTITRRDTNLQPTESVTQLTYIIKIEIKQTFNIL